MAGPLGRRTPPDFEHVAKFALAELALPVPGPTEKSLGLPVYWKLWDQGQEGSCVGYGTSAMSGITNTRQLRLANPNSSTTLRFAPHWLYEQAQLVDEWGDTPPEEGTSVRAACDVLRVQGHRRVRYGVAQAVDAKWGISANRWATTVDEVRAAIYADLAVSIGISWYSNFDNPVMFDNELWVGRSALGSVRGGHCVALYRMSDRRQAFRLMNSWGPEYPPVWLPYTVLERLISEDGEVVVISDR
jgi:hypothetical protein